MEFAFTSHLVARQALAGPVHHALLRFFAVNLYLASSPIVRGYCGGAVAPHLVLPGSDLVISASLAGFASAQNY